MAETVLAVFAHPDDETLACGGTLAKHAQAGDATYVLILADGVTSRLGNAVARRDAFWAAAHVLGFCGLLCNRADQRLDQLPLLDIIGPIDFLIAGREPSIVYTHYRGDLNRDHQIVAEAVLVATRPQPDCSVKRVYAGEVPSSTEWAGPSTFQPTVFVDVAATMLKKFEAMQCYAEELRPRLHPRSLEGIEILAKHRGRTIGVEYAEAFQLVREIR